MPTHYEPAESPVRNDVYKQDTSPASILYPRDPATSEQLAGHAATFPYIFTTYRLTEHHTAGGMSRTLSRLSELQPELFCEVSPQLAAERGLANGGWATIVSARPAIEARVLVTRRQRPLRLADGAVVHQVGLPYHWGSEGLVTGDVVNDLLLHSLRWDYPEQGDEAEPDAEAVLQEINGRRPDGTLLNGFAELKPDGSTQCGCWIYSGCYAGGVNQTARRKPQSEQSWVAPEWGWAWPANRRLLYNRASADPQGKPWSEKKRYVWWNEEKREWTGHDVPDFEKTKPPDYIPPDGAIGPAALAGTDPFIMQRDGKGALFVWTGLKDGPMPTHYEPAESPVRNDVYKQDTSPASILYPRDPATLARIRLPRW